MTTRESWVKRDPITQQVLRDGSGNPITVTGNVNVDFVWGNYAMQPNDDRLGGGPTAVVAPNVAQNRQWSGWSVIDSDTLQNNDYSVSIGNIYGVNNYPVPADSHINTAVKWNAFPDYTPQAGITEAGTASVPSLTGLTAARAAEVALENGFRVIAVTETPSNAHAPGFVYAQDKTGSHTYGTGITISVYVPLNGANAGVKYNTAVAPWVNGTVAG